MDRLQWGQKTPGHLLFLIDQSGSMCCKDIAGKTLADRVIEAVQSAVIDCVDGCISGMVVKNRFFLTIIGYGNSVSILKEDWAKSLVPELQAIKTNGGTLIPAVSDGWTPMAEAFELAKECLEGWLETCQEKVDEGSYLGIPAPIVINITDGEPEDGTPTAKSRAASAAKDILNLSGTDGNVIVFNLHISDDETEICFPDDKSSLNCCSQGEFLFDLSSDLSEELVNAAKRAGMESAHMGSKGLVVNANGSTITRFINFGSGSGF